MFSDIDFNNAFGVSVSSNNFKAATVDYFEAYKNNYYVDGLLYGYENYTLTSYNETMVSYIYVNVDVKITGTYKENDYRYDYTEEYNANLKAGWNTVYMIYKGTSKSDTQIFTTQKPNTDLKWYFGDDIGGGYYDDFAPTKENQNENKPTERGFRSFELFKK